MEAIENMSSCESSIYMPRDKKKHLSKKTKDYIFVIIMLAYPVLQFVITWSFVNINSLLLAFQTGDGYGGYEWYGFQNFINYFNDLFYSKLNTTGIPWLNNTSVILLNSLGFGVITIFISLPLSAIFSYFLSKKMFMANVFRAIFFLPNIIPIVALTFAFTVGFNPQYGYLSPILESLGLSGLFSHYPSSQIMVYIYCIWAGLGYNIILLSGAIGRIPKELFESAKLDHAGYFKEFFHIVIPCIWPTIITLVILGMTNVLTLYLQPYLIGYYDIGNTYTISLDIFLATSSYFPDQYCSAAAKGLLFSAIWAPVILLTRHFLSKKFSGVDY